MKREIFKAMIDVCESNIAVATKNPIYGKSIFEISRNCIDIEMKDSFIIIDLSTLERNHQASSVEHVKRLMVPYEDIAGVIEYQDIVEW